MRKQHKTYEETHKHLEWLEKENKDLKKKQQDVTHRNMVNPVDSTTLEELSYHQNFDSHTTDGRVHKKLNVMGLGNNNNQAQLTANSINEGNQSISSDRNAELMRLKKEYH